MAAVSRTRELDWLQESYTQENKSPFKHFFCPMLMKDEHVELMLGHVVNEKFRTVPEYLIRQRQDIDGWYGSVFEADFITVVKSREKNLNELFLGGKPARGLRPVIRAGGEEIPFYSLKDGQEPIETHTLLELQGNSSGFMRFALKKTPAEVRSLQQMKWRSEISGDFRIAAFVSLLKAAYLTLFWKFGYKYALSTAGMSIGHHLLGRFFEENRGERTDEVREAAAEFFKPHLHMVRPVEFPGPNPPRGTIEDNRAFVWLGSSGRGLGIGVFVRTDDQLHCVLMPAYSDADSIGTYEEFRRNDSEEIWVREGEFNETKQAWDLEEQRVRVVWPKQHESFDLSFSPEETLSRPS
jgi:hypothetical protein